MLAVSAPQTQMLQRTSRASYVKVEVRNAANNAWNELTAYSVNNQTLNFLTSAVIKDSVDTPSASATLTFHRDIFYYNLSPLMANSILNINGTLLDLNRQVRLSLAVVPMGTKPQSSSDYTQVFYGRIYDMDFGPDTTFVVQCADMMNELLSWWNESLFSIGSSAGVAVETVIQNILNTVTANTGYTPYLSTLYTPASPGWMIRTHNQEQMAVSTAVSNLSGQIGWLIRQKWKAAASAFALTLYDPNRTNTTSTWTFGPGVVFDQGVTKCGVHLGDIRNVIHVTYYDASLGGAPQRYVVTDATSISLYGRQFMQLAEESTSQINSATEAALMANGALSDLSQPKLDYVVNVPLFWPTELTDVYTFSADGRHFDSDQKLAVVGWQHTIEANGFGTTELSMRGKPSGGVRVWFDKQYSNVRKQYGTYNASPNIDLSTSIYPNSSMSQYSKT